MKWTRRAVLLTVLTVSLLGCSGYSEDTQFVASRERDPFHKTTCEWAGKISPSNLQEFSTRSEAISAGHRPCKVCKP